MNNYLLLFLSFFLFNACHMANKTTSLNFDNSNISQNCQIVEIVHDENLSNSRFFDAIKYGNPYRRIELKKKC